MSTPKGVDIFMASKGQKFKKYSKELKDIVLKEYHEGYSSPYLAKKFGIPRGTIESWEQQLRHPKLRKQGRPRKEDIDYKERYEILKKYQAVLRAQRERK